MAYPPLYKTKDESTYTIYLVLYIPWGVCLFSKLHEGGQTLNTTFIIDYHSRPDSYLHSFEFLVHNTSKRSTASGTPGCSLKNLQSRYYFLLPTHRNWELILQSLELPIYTFLIVLLDQAGLRSSFRHRDLMIGVSLTSCITLVRYSLDFLMISAASMSNEHDLLQNLLLFYSCQIAYNKEQRKTCSASFH